MNPHAGWTQDGYCVACGARTPSKPCDPGLLWDRLLAAKRALRHAVDAVEVTDPDSTLTQIVRNLAEKADV